MILINDTGGEAIIKRRGDIKYIFDTSMNTLTTQAMLHYFEGILMPTFAISLAVNVFPSQHVPFKLTLSNNQSLSIAFAKIKFIKHWYFIVWPDYSQKARIDDEHDAFIHYRDEISYF